LYFCSTKCFKNLVKLNRKPRETKWTLAYQEEKEARLKTIGVKTEESAPKKQKEEKAPKKEEAPKKAAEKAKPEASAKPDKKAKADSHKKEEKPKKAPKKAKK
jgi:hypothetical protein